VSSVCSGFWRQLSSLVIGWLVVVVVVVIVVVIIVFDEYIMVFEY